MELQHRLIIHSALLGSFFLSLFGFLIVPAKARPPAVLSGAFVEQADFSGLGLEPFQAQHAAGCQISPQFPPEIQRWCVLITRHADRYGLSPDLIASVMLQESAGDPLAYSRSGAVGLMQVMPRDGLAAGFQCINGPCFSSRPSIKQLQDPDYNVAYGTELLAGLIERNGSVLAGLHAYGPMDVGYSYANKVLRIQQNLAP